MLITSHGTRSAGELGEHRAAERERQRRTLARKDLDVLMGNCIEAVRHASLLAGEGCYEFDWLTRDPRTIRYPVATDARTAGSQTACNAIQIHRRTRRL